MSMRLQVVLSGDELEEIREAATAQGMTVSEWVRRALRRARRQVALGDPARRLAAVRAATRHEFPTADIETMLQQIERGYLGRG